MLSVSVVSAGWFTGNSVKTYESGEEMIIEDGEDKEFDFFPHKLYNISFNIIYNEVTAEDVSFILFQEPKFGSQEVILSWPDKKSFIAKNIRDIGDELLIELVSELYKSMPFPWSNYKMRVRVIEVEGSKDEISFEELIPSISLTEFVNAAEKSSPEPFSVKQPLEGEIYVTKGSLFTIYHGTNWNCYVVRLFGINMIKKEIVYTLPKFEIPLLPDSSYGDNNIGNKCVFLLTHPATGKPEWVAVSDDIFSEDKEHLISPEHKKQYPDLFEELSIPVSLYSQNDTGDFSKSDNKEYFQYNSRPIDSLIKEFYKYKEE